MALDGADGQAGDDGDLGEFELFDEAEHKDASLTLGELGDSVPDALHLIFSDEACLGGAVAVRDVLGDLRPIDGVGGGALPEAEASGAGVVAKEVEGDPHEPGGDGTGF